jgi:hypothetical protein
MSHKIFVHAAPLQKYAWPGGYPIHYWLTFTYDRTPVPACCACTDEIRTKAAITNAPDDQILIQAQINWEDPYLTCEFCSKRIESAYVEDHASGKHTGNKDAHCFLCAEDR